MEYKNITLETVREDLISSLGLHNGQGYIEELIENIDRQLRIDNMKVTRVYHTGYDIPAEEALTNVINTTLDTIYADINERSKLGLAATAVCACVSKGVRNEVVARLQDGGYKVEISSDGEIVISWGHASISWGAE